MRLAAPVCCASGKEMAKKLRSDEKRVRWWTFRWLLERDRKLDARPGAKEEFPAFFHKPVWV
jgi:hypothetical protein